MCCLHIDGLHDMLILLPVYDCMSLDAMFVVFPLQYWRQAMPPKFWNT